MAVTVSGMFGTGKTYFADSPVMIDIDGLEWSKSGEAVTSPFTIVGVEVIGHVSSEIPSSTSGKWQQLREMFPDSNAPFYDDTMGYITSASVWQIADMSGDIHNSLVVTGYSNTQYAHYGPEEYELFVFASNYPANYLMPSEEVTWGCMVELDSTQERRDTLLRLCKEAYIEDGAPIENTSKDTTDNSPLFGVFRADTGGQTSISFDISSALRAIWSGYDYNGQGAEVEKANSAVGGSTSATASRSYREYSLQIYTEYLANDDGGVFTQTVCEDEDGNTIIPGGRCAMGGLTEWERSMVGSKENADVSYHEHRNLRNGDASTKPTSSPERVGKDSITSWVDVQSSGTQSVFYPANATVDPDAQSSTSPHAPLVLRDKSQSYVDFLFVNRRGAVETCSGLTKEAMSIDVEMKQYVRVERPTFQPSRSLMAIGTDGRRSWQMSSGPVTREWAEWWTMEFLGGKRKQWWMKYKGKYVPVIVKPAKSSTEIYNRAKQQTPHVDFTVTLALEG